MTSLETVQLEKLDISHQVRAVQRFVDAWIVILCQTTQLSVFGRESPYNLS